MIYFSYNVQIHFIVELVGDSFLLLFSYRKRFVIFQFFYLFIYFLEIILFMFVIQFECPFECPLNTRTAVDRWDVWTYMDEKFLSISSQFHVQCGSASL